MSVDTATPDLLTPSDREFETLTRQTIQKAIDVGRALERRDLQPQIEARDKEIARLNKLVEVLSLALQKSASEIDSLRAEIAQLRTKLEAAEFAARTNHDTIAGMQSDT